MKNYPFLLVLLLLGVFTPACGQNTDAAYHTMLNNMYAGTVSLIKPEAVDTLNSPLILDTREKNEYEVSHIENARWVGFDTFDDKTLADLPKDTLIVLYCSVGYRSERIGERLQELGFTNIYNLYGGIFEWKNHNHPVVDTSGHETDKIHAYSKKWGVWLYKGEKVY